MQKMGNGCTSGHGICGMARLSRRSFAAVLSFMASAVVTVYAISPMSFFAPYTTWLRRESVPEPSRILGLVLTVVFLIGSFLLTRYESTTSEQEQQQYQQEGAQQEDAESSSATAAAAATVMTEDSLLVDKNIIMAASANPQDGVVVVQDSNEHRKLVAAGVSGSIMSIGLGLSQMVAPSKIYGFLDVTGFARGTWDPTLAFVMGGGVVVSALGYAFIGYFGKRDQANAMSCPLALKDDGKFSIPSNTNLDAKLFGGAMIFGIGWAIAGMCPGPALFLVAASLPFVAFLWLPAYILGAYLAQRLSV